MTITLGTAILGPGIEDPFANLIEFNQCVAITTDLAAYMYFNDTSGEIEVRSVAANALAVGTISSPAELIVGISESGVSITAAKLNSNHFLFGYADNHFSPDSCDIGVQICNVPASGTPVPGSTQTLTNFLDGIGTFQTAIARVSDNTGVMFYIDTVTSNLRAIAFTVIGNAVDTIGAPTTIDTIVNNHLNADTFLDDQHVVVGYRKSGGVWAQAISVTGVVVTPGTPVEFQGESFNQKTQIVGMTPTRGALFSNRIVGATSLLSWGRQFSLSGTTITPTGLTTTYGGTLDRDFNRGAIRISDTVGELNYVDTFDAREVITEFTVSDGGNLGINQTTPLELVAPAPLDKKTMGIAHLGDSRSVVLFNEDQIAISTTDLISIIESQLWLTIDGGLNHTKISDPAWTLPVEAVAVMPGTTYNEIWAAVGTEVYKTLNAGDTWILLATLTFTPSAAVLMFDNSVAFYTKETGGNRVSFVDELGVVSNLDIGHTISGVGSAMKAAA